MPRQGAVRKIARAGFEFVRDHLKNEDVKEYWRELLISYSRLQTGSPYCARPPCMRSLHTGLSQSGDLSQRAPCRDRTPRRLHAENARQARPAALPAGDAVPECPWRVMVSLCRGPECIHYDATVPWTSLCSCLPRTRVHCWCLEMVCVCTHNEFVFASDLKTARNIIVLLFRHHGKTLLFRHNFALNLINLPHSSAACCTYCSAGRCPRCMVRPHG